MALINNAAISALIKPNISGTPVDLKFRRTDLFDWFDSRGLVKPWEGGSAPRKWNLQYGNTSGAELFVEDQALGAAGGRLMVQASQEPFYARSRASVTGKVLDQTRNGGTFDNVLDQEIASAIIDVMVLVDSTLAGSAQDKGIASIVDAGDTYAGVAPGSYTTHASKETGSIGTLDAADMRTFFLAMRDDPYDAHITDILTDLVNFGRYEAIVGTSATAPLLRYAPGQPLDVSMLNAPIAFSGIPMHPIRSLDSGEMYWLDVPNSEIRIEVFRDITTEPLAKVNDNVDYMVSMALAMMITNRRKAGKMTGIT